MITFSQSVRTSSTRKSLMLLTLALLLANAYAVCAQGNSNNANGNGSSPNLNGSSPNLNANHSGTVNSNKDTTANHTANVNDASGQGGSAGGAPGDDLTKSGWFLIIVSILFIGILGPFIYAITRAILFSKSTFNSPLGLPDGSLRAILAFMLVAFLGVYVYGYVLKQTVDFKPPDFLLGIVATVVGFYFGSRTSDDKGVAARPGTVQGKVTDKNGAPAIGATVGLSQSGVRKFTQTTDVSGQYKIENVPVGDYDAEASLAGNQPSGPTKVKVTAGAVLTVDLKLQ